jgi:transcriptional regulator with XRE-family HTH domain
VSNIKISGKRIKEIRENNNFSQSNIATFLGVDQSLISKVEKDERALSSDMLEKLAALFGVHQKAFSAGSAEKPLAYALRASDLTADDMNTISAINKIALNCDFVTSLLNGANTSDGN